MFDQEIHDRLTATYPPFANWQGHQIQKNPFDLLLYQEAIYETGPRGVIETGSMHGGSALFFADMLRITHGWEAKVGVLSFDTFPRDFPDDPRCTFVNADSASSDAVNECVKFLNWLNGPVMVVLDGDHSDTHVAKELVALAGLVTPGQWLVVEDTSHTTGIRAVEAWSAEHPEFQPVDQSRYLCTYNSWFRRT